MNQIQTTSRELVAANYYAAALQKYVPSLCKQPAQFIRNDSIKDEFHRRVIVYAVEKFAVIPCIISEPGYFFGATSICLLTGFLAGAVFEKKYPAPANERKGGKDYFESTIVLNDTPRRLLFAAFITKAVATILLSSFWPEDFVFYNAVTIGLGIGVVLGFTCIQSNCLKKAFHRTMDPALTEPFIDNAEYQV